MASTRPATSPISAPADGVHGWRVRAGDTVRWGSVSALKHFVMVRFVRRSTSSGGAAGGRPESGAAPAPGGGFSFGSGWSWAVPLGVAVLALGCRLVPVLVGTGLAGRDGYDPYVYYAAAVAVFTGHVPYRDFLLLHPPGVLVVLQPFAALGALFGDSVGMAAARVGFMLIGVASCLLVYRILARSAGRTAALIGSVMYAVWRPAVYTERNVRLEAVATLVVLIGLLVLQRTERTARAASWSPAWAGAWFALSAVVKIWGVVPLAVLAVWLLIAWGWRAAARCTLGAAAVFAVVFGPLSLVAPQWFGMVVVDQLGRNRSAVSEGSRLAQLVGLPSLSAGVVALIALGLALVVIAAALVVALRVPAGRLAAVLTLSMFATLLVGPSWFAHYPAFVAGPLCLVVGTAAGWAADRVPAARLRPAVVPVLVGVLAVAGIVILPRGGVRFDGPRVAAILADRPGCITTDTAATLILSDTLRRNLTGGCPVVVDLTGYSYQPSPNRKGPKRVQDPTFQRFAMCYLRTGTSTIVIRLVPDGLTKHNRLIVESWPIVGQAGDVAVRQPTPAKTG